MLSCRYCGSCIAKTTRSWSEGFASSGPQAETCPGRLRVQISTKPSRPLTGNRTMAPSELISSASFGRHTRVTECPAIANFVASSDP